MPDHSPTLEDGLNDKLLKRLGEGVSTFSVVHNDHRSSLSDAKCLTLEQLQAVEAKDYGLEVGLAWDLFPYLPSLWSLFKEKPIGRSWSPAIMSFSRNSEHLQAG